MEELFEVGVLDFATLWDLRSASTVRISGEQHHVRVEQHNLWLKQGHAELLTGTPRCDQ